MRADERDAYFASGAYLQDVRCDFFLDFDRLTDQLSRVMVDELGYTPEIVAFLKRNGGRVNVSREDGKRRAMRELARAASESPLCQFRVRTPPLCKAADNSFVRIALYVIPDLHPNISR